MIETALHRNGHQPAAAPAGERTLGFVVIGAQKAATTTLWRGLDSHPQVRTPGDKERGFFNSDGRYEKGLDAFLDETFSDAPPDAVLGTVTPDYMPASKDGLAVLVQRMRETIPATRLVAILRDPIERAISHYRTGLRTGNASLTTFDEHFDWVCRDRGVIWPPIIRRGEYGRILARYLDAFPRGVFRHLGVDPGHVPDLDVRLNRGGLRPRASADEVERILDHLREQAWPHVPARREAQRALEWWVRHLWNIEADDAGRTVSDPLRRRLQERYLADADVLRGLTGLEPPWVAEYEFALGRGAHRIAA